jgi:thiazole synthase
MAVSVTINGEEQSLERPLSLADLLIWLEIKKGKVAIERNLEIVPKSLYGETMVEDGDRLEIVHFIGGG